MHLKYAHAGTGLTLVKNCRFFFKEKKPRVGEIYWFVFRQKFMIKYISSMIASRDVFIYFGKKTWSHQRQRTYTDYTYTSNSFPKSLPDLTNLFQLKELIIWIYIMTRDLTDQKGCGTMVPVLPTLTWYIFVISWHSFNKMKYYQSEFCIRNSIELNWCGHKKRKLYCFQKTD